MKKNIMIAATLTLGAIVGAYTFYPTLASSSQVTQPGSVDDPLVTKSYLEQYIKGIGGVPTGGSNTGAAPSLDEAKVRQFIAEEISKAGSGNNGNNNTGSTPSLTVVELKNGQTLYAGAGTEVIVRSGKTVAVSNDENGIPDVTAGKDIAAGTAIELNHMLLFPREGRGIKVDSKNTQAVFVMVRGAYTLE